MNNTIQKVVNCNKQPMKFSIILFVALNFSALITTAQWVRSDQGIDGGNINAFAVSGAKIFAATEGSGVYVSTNDGWIAVNTGLSKLYVQALTFSGSNIFAGTSGGIYLSINNGNSWGAVNTGLTNTSITSFAVSGSNVFAGTGGGVFLSSNNGTSWTAVNTGLTGNGLFVQSLVVSGSNIFAGTSAGVFLSTNNGTSWTAVNTGLSNLSVLSLAISGSNIFAGTAGGGVFLSTNNGTSWTAVNTGLSNLSVLSLAISESNIFAGTNGGSFLSTNNGTNWTSASTGLDDVHVQCLAVLGSNLYAGTPRGVSLSSNNGTNWATFNAGLKNIIASSLVVNGSTHFVGTYWGVFMSSDNGANWAAVNTGLTNLTVSSLAMSGSNLFAGTAGGGVFLSTNNGASWTAINTGLTNLDVYSLATSGTTILAGTSNGIFISTNNGANWTFSTGLLAGTAGNCFTSIGTTLFAGTNSGAYKSTNNGATWTASGTGLNNPNVESLAVLGTNLFAGTQNGIYTSTDNGLNWVITPSTGLPDSAIPNAMAATGTTLFIGTNYKGVFVSKDNSNTWKDVSFPGFPGVGTYAYVYTLALSSTHLFAGIENYGLWSRALGEFNPTVSSFSPAGGPVGTTVTITGTGFSTTPAYNNVSFNGTSATVTSSTATSITTTVPPGATTGSIAVTIGSLTATSSSNFIVGNLPVITSFSPASGLVGTTVTITGTGFSTTPGNNSVNFNGTAATVTASTATSITTTVPTGATTGTVSVTVNSLTGTSSSNFTVIVPDTSKPIVANHTNGTADQGSSITITAAISDAESGITITNLLYRSIAAGGDFTSVPLNNVSGQDYTQTIPAGESGELGVEYKFDVTNGAGLKNDEVLYTVRVSIPGNGLEIPYTSPGVDISNYRIVAVPLELTSKSVGDVFDELGPVNDTRWRMSRYQNGSNQELNLSSVIEPGNGYWLIAKEDPGVINSGTGVTVEVSTTSPFEIDLVAGWNQIGNPYNFNVDWADVQAANSGLPGLRKYMDTFVDATALDKMEGGFVNVSADRKIVIPVIKNNAVNGGRISQAKNSIDSSPGEKNWQVYLQLDQGNHKNRIAGFGMHEDASAGYDAFDGLTMPRFFNSWLEVNHTKKNKDDFYSKDIVPAAENHVWEFLVESSEGEPNMTFTWNNTYFGANCPGLYLWDNALQRSVDMRNVNQYAFNKNLSKSFKVVYGSAEFVKGEISVTDIMLYDVWPNPARENDEVTLSFSIPESASGEMVNINVVDMLGRRVWSNEASLFAGGYHEVKWKRTGEEKEGLYIVLLRAGGALKQMRMVLK